MKPWTLCENIGMPINDSFPPPHFFHSIANHWNVKMTKMSTIRSHISYTKKKGNKRKERIHLNQLKPKSQDARLSPECKCALKLWIVLSFLCIFCYRYSWQNRDEHSSFLQVFEQCKSFWNKKNYEIYYLLFPCDSTLLHLKKMPAVVVCFISNKTQSYRGPLAIFDHGWKNKKTRAGKS